MITRAWVIVLCHTHEIILLILFVFEWLQKFILVYTLVYSLVIISIVMCIYIEEYCYKWCVHINTHYVVEISCICEFAKEWIMWLIIMWCVVSNVNKDGDVNVDVVLWASCNSHCESMGVNIGARYGQGVAPGMLLDGGNLFDVNWWLSKYRNELL